MIEWLFPVFAIATLPLAVANVTFLAEMSLGLFSSRVRNLPEFPVQSTTLLVPAHNEEATLLVYAESFRRILAQGFQILVVADNCTDGTAKAAAAFGCDVVERVNPTERGKGYALAAGRDHLAQNPPDIVIVLDADCEVDGNSLRLLANQAMHFNRPVQAAYLFRPEPHARPNILISNFAFAVKNLVRQRGARRLGAAAILTGSGMAFPWRIMAELDLATGNIVEDLALGIELVRGAEPPIFEEHAVIWSDASSSSGTETQRARWESGFVATARGFALPLIVEGLQHRRWPSFWLGLHLLVPPLTILLMANILVSLLAVAAAAFGLGSAPALWAGSQLLLVCVAVAAAWATEGRRHLSAAGLLKLPAYIFWKLLLYARLLTGRTQAGWTRTERFKKPD